MEFDNLYSSAFNVIQHLLAKYQQEKTANNLEALQQQVDALRQQPLTYSSELTHLHPTIQQVAASLWGNNHYRQAVLDSCIALDKAVQDKAGLSATSIGVSLMTTAFSANQPLIRLSQDRSEQTGFMNLYQGSVQAIRNHYAHNLTEIPAARTLEWLNFISALFYKLDEAHRTSSAS